MLCRCEFLKVFLLRKAERFQNAQFLLELQDAANRKIKASFCDSTFFHEFDQQFRKIVIVRYHAHVDTGFNRHKRGFLEVGSNFVVEKKFHHIFPIGYGYTFEFQLIAQQTCKDFLIGMNRNSIDFA